MLLLLLLLLRLQQQQQQQQQQQLLLPPQLLIPLVERVCCNTSNSHRGSEESLNSKNGHRGSVALVMALVVELYNQDLSPVMIS